MTTALHILEAIGALLGGCVLIGLKYWQMKSIKEQQNGKADVQTLFSGEK